MHKQVKQTAVDTGGKQVEQTGWGGGVESLAVRAEMACWRSSWHLALRSFSSARAALTSASLVFNLVWSNSKASTEGLLEEEPETGVKGV